MKLFKRITYLKLKKYKTVFEFGSIGFRFFIILKGEIAVLLPKSKVE